MSNGITLLDIAIQSTPKYLLLKESLYNMILRPMFFAAYFWIEIFTDLCLVKCFLDLLSDLSSCKNCFFPMLYFSTSFLPVSLIYIYWELDIPVPSEI